MLKRALIVSGFLLILIFPTVLLAGYSSCGGNCYRANSCSQGDVQSAVNAAGSAGGTIQIPAGNCTWTSRLTVNASARDIQVTGDGVNSVVITLNAPGGGDILFYVADGYQATMSGITFDLNLTDTDNIVQVDGSGRDVFRFYNLKFINSKGHSLFWISSPSAYGVIHTIDLTGAAGELANVGAGGTNSGCRAWAGPDYPGTADAVFLEDSRVVFNNHNEGVPLIDTQYGGKYVIRYNNLTNVALGNHGADSSECGGLLAEIYNNSFEYKYWGSGCTWNISGGGWRAGQVVVHHNQFSFDDNCWISDKLKLSVYRTEGLSPAWKYSCDPGNLLKFCSQLNADWSGSLIDCKQDSDCGGGWCKWKLCSGSMTLCTSDRDCPGSETCSSYVDGGSSGLGGNPCFNQPGRGPGNQLSPAYEWNNTISGARNQNGCKTGSQCPLRGFAASNILISGKDYFGGTAKPGYVPYTYPHPSRGSMAPPMNLRVVP